MLALSHATGMHALDAQADFRRARRAHWRTRITSAVRRGSGCRHPCILVAPAAKPGGSRRLEVVPLDAVIGTVEPTVHFDARFRPTSEATRRRWERVALAHRRGDALPPIEVLREPNGYYVVDGRHRVSVSRALGHRDIDAWVTGMRQ